LGLHIGSEPNPTYGTRIYIIKEKTKMLIKDLKGWNKTIFKEINKTNQDIIGKFSELEGE